MMTCTPPSLTEPAVMDLEVMGDVHDPYGLSIIVEVEDVAKQRAAFDLLEKGAMYDEGSGEDGGRRRKAEHRNGGDDGDDRVVSSEVKRDAVRCRCSIGFDLKLDPTWLHCEIFYRAANDRIDYPV